MLLHRHVEGSTWLKGLRALLMQVAVSRDNPYEEGFGTVRHASLRYETLQQEPRVLSLQLRRSIVRFYLIATVESFLSYPRCAC